ncbi:hypothetical protein [Pandoraea norimbergensis]|uniref:Uncharacterized protein n=1 Tax=Pandoraea norimbergensis TaxID=93219 RepID=A0ABN4JGU8_9BURK|nr:hypothetical protein [Pandoraea norimbergensis]ALS60031.1 hypothetical protein AT302_09915 [Pandoraea norimbergensis]
MTGHASIRLAVSPPLRGAGSRLRGRFAAVAPPPPAGVAPPDTVVAAVASVVAVVTDVTVV